MVDELVIHIGDCKTGSTAIQSCLSGDCYRIEDGTIAYPALFNHMGLAQTLAALPAAVEHHEKRNQRFSAISQAMMRSDATYGIISAEHFEFVPPDALRSALDEFFPDWRGRTRIIAYVRPHHSRIVSAYAESLKKLGRPTTMERFFEQRLKARRFHYTPRFQAWRDVFGEAFFLRPFLREALTGGDVVADFFTFLLQDRKFDIRPSPQRNETLKLEELAMLKSIHGRFEGADTDDRARKARMQFGWNFAMFLCDRIDREGTRLAMHQSLSERVADTYRKDARDLDRMFFGEPLLERELERSVATAQAKVQSLEIEDHFTSSEISVMHAWGDFIWHIIEADPTHFVWASKPVSERPKNIFSKS